MDTREKIINAIEKAKKQSEGYAQDRIIVPFKEADMIIALLKEQDELLKHEYWRGYNNGRADERGLHEGTIMQTFSPD